MIQKYEYQDSCPYNEDTFNEYPMKVVMGFELGPESLALVQLVLQLGKTLVQ